MSTKRLFQVLDEMNVNDENNKTATCAVCFQMVSANKSKGGGLVTMGVPDEAIQKIFIGEYTPILVLMDKKEYERLKDQPIETEQALAEAERAQKLADYVNLVYQKANEGIEYWNKQIESNRYNNAINDQAYEALRMHETERDFCKRLMDSFPDKFSDRPCPHCGKELNRDRNLCCRECGKEVEG